MKVAIVIDDWKISVFSKGLRDAGYAFSKHPGVTPDTLTLGVEVDDEERALQYLKVLVFRLQREAATMKSRMTH